MNNKGLTLIELLFVIAILAILAAIAIPAFNDLLNRQKVNGEANVLFSMIYLARTEAIKRSKVITVCKSLDGKECGGSWSDGWLMFVDNDEDGTLDLIDTIVTSNTAADEVSVNWTAFGSNNYIRLTPRGMTLSQNGTFTVCPDNDNNYIARTVVVSKLARVRLPPAGKNADGDAIECF